MKPSTNSKIIYRPHSIVFVLYASIVLTMVGFGMWMIWGQQTYGGMILSYGIGLLSMAVGLGFGRNVSELCSVKIDDKGISQWKIMRGKRLLLRDKIEWRDDVIVIDDGLRIVLKSASVEIRVNLSFFNDMDEVSEFIEDRAVRRNGS